MGYLGSLGMVIGVYFYYEFLVDGVYWNFCMVELLKVFFIVKEERERFMEIVVIC